MTTCLNVLDADSAPRHHGSADHTSALDRRMNMSARRLVPPIAVLLLAPPAAAQQSQQMGTVELGVFGQYAYMDTPWAMKNGFGIGGRLGVFLRERYLIEGDRKSVV